VFKLPIPPNTGSQHIEHFNSSIKGTVVMDNANPPHRILTATLHHERGDSRRVDWRVEIVGQFQTRQLVDGPPTSTTPMVAPAPGEFLASTESINWDSEDFGKWLDSSGLRRTEGESAVHFGKRVYDYFKANGRYEYPPTSAWNAAAVSRRLHTDCGGFSLVFVAACRANKIPARLLVGQCFKARKEANGSVELTGERQTHVIAEFFDPQIGWIPEDISSLFLKMPGYADYDFFGRDPGYFFAWHFDADFHFDLPRKDNAHIQWIQNPSLWFSADADDANDSASHHWTVDTLK
jgi:transglutaminase-like putative cysteine protease